MVGPRPLNPLAWEFIVSSGGHLRHGDIFFLSGGGIQLSAFDRVDARGTEAWRAIRASGQLPGFLGWARFPWVAPASSPRSGPVKILDARYTRQATSGFGGATVQLTEETRLP